MKYVAVNDRGRRIGEGHWKARCTDDEVVLVLKLRDEGMSYGQIAKIAEMPKSTVASYCCGHRRCQTPDRYKAVEQ